MHLVLYASDHGFGHAMRMLALAEVLCSRGVRITFCAGPAPAPVLAAALGRLTPAPALHRVELDAGLIARPRSLAVDEARSAEAVRAWLERLPRLISEEAARLRALAPDLVVADAPPAAVAAAAQAGVPVVVCSNFTWLDLYGERFGDAVIRALEAAYAHARLGLRLHPGSMPLRGVPADRIVDMPGLLARGPRRSRAQVRAELGVPDDLPLLALGLGRSLDQTLPPSLAGATPQAAGAALLMPGPGVPSDPGRGVFFLPSDTPDIPDYLGAADAILAKAGYSTIAEGALGGVPLLLFPVAGNPETQLLCQQTQDAGWGLVLHDEAEALSMACDPARAITIARARSRSSSQAPAPAAPAVADAVLSVLI